MRVAALYDIHGNLPALDAALADVARYGVDRIVIGGDVLPGPMPAECLDRLATVETPIDYLAGNGDRETLSAGRGEESDTLPQVVREALRWTSAQLSDAHIELLTRWPPVVEHQIAGLGKVLFCHATPQNDLDIFTPRTPETALIPVFADHDAAVVVCGHTHIHFQREVGSKRIVNSGSVGMPFEAQGAYWTLLGPDIEPQHVAYDYAEAARHIAATEYPSAAQFAEDNVLNTPDREEMIAMFERSAIGGGVNR